MTLKYIKKKLNGNKMKWKKPTSISWSQETKDRVDYFIKKEHRNGFSSSTEYIIKKFLDAWEKKYKVNKQKLVIKEAKKDE